MQSAGARRVVTFPEWKPHRSHDTPFYEPASAPRLPTGEPAAAPVRSDAPRGERLAALIEVLLCSGLPTQLVIGQALALGGWSPFTAAGVPQAGPLFALALHRHARPPRADRGAAARTRRDDARPAAGRRAVGREAWFGLALVPALFLAVGVTLLALRRLLPWLHNVPANPFQHLIRTHA